MEITRGELTEKELDTLITCRHDQRVKDEGHRPSEELWAASERAYFARKREEMRAAWCAHHQGQAARHRATLQALIEHHEAAAAQLREAEASNAWSSRYAKTGSGIVPRLSTSTAPSYEG